MEKPDYGNWVPQKVLLFFLLASILSYLVTLFLDTQLLVGVFRIVSTLYFGFSSALNTRTGCSKNTR